MFKDECGLLAAFLYRAFISERLPEGATSIFSYLLCREMFQTHVFRVAPDWGPLDDPLPTELPRRGTGLKSLNIFCRKPKSPEKKFLSGTSGLRNSAARLQVRGHQASIAVLLAFVSNTLASAVKRQQF